MVNTLGEIGIFTKGEPLSKADIAESGTPFILYGELYTTYHEVAYEIKRKTQRTAAPDKYSQIGDVIIPTSGEAPDEIATATCVMIPGVILAGDLNIFRTKELDGRIVSYIINHKAKYDIARIAQGKSVVHINADELSRIRISYPCYEEQKKLLAFLELLDRKIHKRRDLIASLKSYKRGVLEAIFHESGYAQKMCTRQHFCTLGDLMEKVTERNSDGNNKNVLTNSAERGLVRQIEYFDKSIAVDGNTQNYYIIRKGDFVYNPRKSTNAPYGPFNVYDGEMPGIVSPLYTCLRPKADFDENYLFWYFQSSAWHRYMYFNGSMGARHDRVSITDEILMRIPVILLDSSNMKKVSSLMNGIQKRLQAETALLENMEKVKKALYSKMFA